MKKKIGIVLTVLLVTAACLLSSWLLIGEPVDGKQLAYQITEHPSYLDLQVTAVESAVALRGWQLKQEGNDLFIRARKQNPTARTQTNLHTTSGQEPD